MRVVVIDGHAQFAEVVRATMSGEPDFESVGHATNVDEGLDLIESTQPDLVALSIHVGPDDGLAAISQINTRHPDVRVVVLTAYANAELTRRAARANARALHPKDAGPERLRWVLRNAGHEGFTVHPEVLHKLTAGGPLSPQQDGSAAPPPPSAQTNGHPARPR